MNSNIYVEATSALTALSLLIPDQDRSATGVTDISIVYSLQTSFSQEPMLSIEGEPVRAATTPVLVPPPKEKWGTKQMRRFMDLLEKHSLKQTTGAEEAELEILQQLKGHAEDPRSADELLAEWKFRQRVDKILELLQQTAVPHGSQQTRSKNPSRIAT
jgi:hypothetical protein